MDGPYPSEKPTDKEVRGLIIGTPSADSDRAVERAFLDYLEAKHDGTTWRIGERPQAGVPIEPTPGQVERPVSGAVDDESRTPLSDAA